MDGRIREERRLHRRHAVAWTLRGRLLRAVEPGGTILLPESRDLSGTVSNVSTGGLCIAAADESGHQDGFYAEIEASSPVRCEIVISDLPVGIPTLLQVRWARPVDGGKLYELGLQFLV
jgi:hypothetical protein